MADWSTFLTLSDITTVEVRTFEYVPGKHLDVNTFEIKPRTR